MSQNTRQIAGPEPVQQRGPSFLEWFPWEKITIWALFLGLVYLLRHFFFVVFMTFIVAYNMRALVVRISRVLSPSRERPWLERIVTIFCFAALLGAVYGVGRYFVPHLTEQGEKLVGKVGKMVENPQEKLDEVLSDSVGRWLLRDKLGGQGDEAYDVEFEEFRRKGLHPVEYARFQREVRELEESFALALATQETQAALAELVESGEREARLLEWIYTTEHDAILEATRKAYEAGRKLMQEDPALRLLEPPKPFDELGEETQVRMLREHISTQVLADETKRRQYEDRWLQTLAAPRIASLQQDDPARYEELLREHYERTRESEPGKLSYDYDRFVELRATLNLDDKGAAFARALDGIVPEDELSELDRQEKLRGEFEKEKRLALVAEWKQGELARKIGGKVEEYAAAGLGHFTRFVSERVQGLVMLPIQLALSLLLSLFITFDFHKIRRGVLRLKTSRVQGFYEEIAPGLYSFGKLIGRAFQAQAVIAVFNTLLTFIAIQLLGIQNAAFLCAIVFVCSFIPVLGVVLSSVPIAIMAIVQDGGDIILALSAIGAILLIHFIETSILNPKILGDMLHLHPVLVLAILAIGEHFVGVWGLLLGVPVIVYIIRFVILDEGIPGIVEPVGPRAKAKSAGGAGATMVYSAAHAALPGQAGGGGASAGAPSPDAGGDAPEGEGGEESSEVDDPAAQTSR